MENFKLIRQAKEFKRKSSGRCNKAVAIKEQ